RSLHQAAEEERERSPFRGSKLAIPLPGIGPLRCKSSPPPQSKPATSPAPVSSSSHRKHRHRQPSTSTAASATAEFPAGFSSRPGHRRCQSSAPLRDPTSPSSDSR
ncbi:hypothetical protein ILYODFUR_030775, partial [Ilyodon furcidens]